MFSRIFGKRDKPAEATSKELPSQRRPDAPLGVKVPAPAAVAPKPPVPAPAPLVPPMRAAPAARPVPKPTPRPAFTAKGFPADHQIDFVLPTAPQPLAAELTLQQRRDIALETVQQHHQRIANTIRTLWGYRECSVYINKLIMAGGDGMGHARIGFNQDAVEAMLALSDIHDAEFGAPSTLGGALGL